ncbi:uncharacterized protein [Palaemon carinicauda]
MSPSEPDSDDLLIVYESIPARGLSQSSEGNSRKRKRHPSAIPRCHFCKKDLPGITDFCTHAKECENIRHDADDASDTSFGSQYSLSPDELESLEAEWRSEVEVIYIEQT